MDCRRVITHIHYIYIHLRYGSQSTAPIVIYITVFLLVTDNGSSHCIGDSSAVQPQNAQSWDDKVGVET